MRIASWLLVMVAAACSKPNPVVCCSSPADCNSIGASGQTRPCDDGFVCIDHECANAPPLDAAPMCTVDTDCPTATPHCSNNTCVQCENSMQCAGSMPVCDQGTNTCRACVADADCSSAVCESSSGTCVKETEILYASPTGSDASSCSHVDPCSITHALASVDSVHATVRMLAGDYTENLTISGKTLWLDGTGATLTASSVNNAVEITNGTKLSITGLSIISLNTNFSGTAAAIRCETISSSEMTPILNLDGVSTDSTNYGFFVAPCRITATRSHFHGRSSQYANLYLAGGNNGDTSVVKIDRSVIDGGDGVQAIQGATATVTNSLVENMTGPHGALLGTNLYVGVGNRPTSGSLFASFDTLVNAPLICPNGTPSCVAGPTTIDGVCIDNSIITTTTGSAVTGTACIVNHSLAFPQSAALAGAHNLTNVDPRFVDATNNFQLSASSPAVDAADSAATNTIDLVGTARPQGPRDDLGAYEYKP